MSNFVEVPRAWDIERGFLMVDNMEATQENIDNLAKDIERLQFLLTKSRKKENFDEYIRGNREIRWILPHLQKCLDEMRKETKDV
jgi:hypothetical protein